MHARISPITLWVVLCLFISVGLRAGTLPDFDGANRLYEQGKYAEAISRYEALIHSGKASAAIWFNLGNAHFKRGELGRAIYSYCQAETLSPRDPDIAANLRFARDRIAGSASITAPAWHRVVQFFTLNEIAVTAAMFFWFFLLLSAAIRYRPGWRNALRTYVSVTALLLGLSLLFLAAAWVTRRQEAAICVRQVTVHLGPLAESQAAYSVPDGTELKIENRRDNWIQVADRSNRTGWVEAERVLIFP